MKNKLLERGFSYEEMENLMKLHLSKSSFEKWKEAEDLIDAYENDYYDTYNLSEIEIEFPALSDFYNECIDHVITKVNVINDHQYESLKVFFEKRKNKCHDKDEDKFIEVSLEELIQLYNSLTNLK